MQSIIEKPLPKSINTNDQKQPSSGIQQNGLLNPNNSIEVQPVVPLLKNGKTDSPRSHSPSPANNKFTTNTDQSILNLSGGATIPARASSSKNINGINNSISLKDTHPKVPLFHCKVGTKALENQDLKNYLLIEGELETTLVDLFSDVVDGLFAVIPFLGTVDVTKKWTETLVPLFLLYLYNYGNTNYIHYRNHRQADQALKENLLQDKSVKELQIAITALIGEKDKNGKYCNSLDPNSPEAQTLIDNVVQAASHLEIKMLAVLELEASENACAIVKKAQEQPRAKQNTLSEKASSSQSLQLKFPPLSQSQELVSQTSITGISNSPKSKEPSHAEPQSEVHSLQQAQVPINRAPQPQTPEEQFNDSFHRYYASIDGMRAFNEDLQSTMKDGVNENAVNLIQTLLKNKNPLTDPNSFLSEKWLEHEGLAIRELAYRDSGGYRNSLFGKVGSIGALIRYKTRDVRFAALVLLFVIAACAVAGTPQLTRFVAWIDFIVGLGNIIMMLRAGGNTCLRGADIHRNNQQLRYVEEAMRHIKENVSQKLKDQNVLKDLKNPEDLQKLEEHLYAIPLYTTLQVMQKRLVLNMHTSERNMLSGVLWTSFYLLGFGMFIVRTNALFGRGIHSQVLPHLMHANLPLGSLTIHGGVPLTLGVFTLSMAGFYGVGNGTYKLHVLKRQLDRKEEVTLIAQKRFLEEIQAQKDVNQLSPEAKALYEQLKYESKRVMQIKHQQHDQKSIDKREELILKFAIASQVDDATLWKRTKRCLAVKTTLGQQYYFNKLSKEQKNRIRLDDQVRWYLTHPEVQEYAQDLLKEITKKETEKPILLLGADYILANARETFQDRVEKNPYALDIDLQLCDPDYYQSVLWKVLEETYASGNDDVPKSQGVHQNSSSQDAQKVMESRAETRLTLESVNTTDTRPKVPSSPAVSAHQHLLKETLEKLFQRVEDPESREDITQFLSARVQKYHTYAQCNDAFNKKKAEICKRDALKVFQQVTLVN